MTSPPPMGRRTLLGGGVLLLAAGSGGAWHRATRSAGAGAEATMRPDEALAAARAGELLLIDVRRPDEWAATGLPEGAVPIDMRRADFAAALREAAGAADRSVALICARGVRSRRAAVALAEAGLSRVVDVPEGLLGSDAGPGWLARGLPVRAWSGA